MKIKNFMVVFFCMMQLTFVDAQYLCSDFESGIQGWQTNDATSSISSPGLDGSDFLRLKDSG